MLTHKEVKNMLLQDQETKDEFEALEPIYEIKSQLIQLRNEKGLSQKDLAELIGTKQSAISRLESGNYNPSLDFLSKLAHALGKEFHVVFK